MKEVTITGRTIEEAKEQALTQLNVTADRMEVTVIEEPKKGFLGIGSKPAIIKAMKVHDPIEEASTYLQHVIDRMGIAVSIEKKQEDDGIVFELKSEKVAVLIGKRGQTLNALEYLTNLVANRQSKGYVRIYLDAEDYRKRRKETLIQLANRQADKSLKLKRQVALEPMPALERKIIHLALKEKLNISTESKGEGANRHVVIYPAASSGKAKDS